MNLYYEVSDGCIEQFGGKHWMSDGTKSSVVSRELMEMSERVWSEDKNEVRFMKNRNSYCGHVDMKEFMWIKLQSKHI
jgi:hypothetical protein